jgi:hypothetical protein
MQWDGVALNRSPQPGERGSQFDQREKQPLAFALKHPRSAIEYLKSRLGLDPIGSFFFAALFRQMRTALDGWGPAGNYYEFGVGEGRTLLKYIKALETFCHEYGLPFYGHQIYCFDSFQGLPKPAGDEDRHPTWQAGRFAHPVFDIQKRVEKAGVNLGRGSVHFIEGFFQDSLTSQLRSGLAAHPPALVTVDVDFFSSTALVLDWLRPLLRSGTLFYFDDIWSFHGNPRYGELAAIQAFNEHGEGLLTPFPVLGLESLVYIYSARQFEYGDCKG